MSFRKVTRQLAIAVLLAAGLLATSCSQDNTTTAPPAPSADLIGGLIGTVDRVAGSLLTCRPLPYASNSEVIGPAGGHLRIGPHTLRVPAGALRTSVRITGEAPSDNVNSVRLFPTGLQFDRPASLTMSYSNCSLVSRLLPKRIANTTEDLAILTWLISIDDILNQQVTGRLDHFSRYAVGY